MVLQKVDGSIYCSFRAGLPAGPLLRAFAKATDTAMTDNRKTEKSFDLDKLDLVVPDPEKKAPSQAPVPPPVPQAPFDSGKRPAPPPPDPPGTGDAPGPRINRPAKILLTVLFAATALTWLFLLLIVIWESILN